MSDHHGVKPMRPGMKRPVGPVVFTAADQVELVTGVEVMIDAEVDLVAVVVRAGSSEHIVTAVMANPAIPCRIQTVAGPKVVRKWHLCEDPLDPSGLIEARPQRIAGEYAERLKIAGR